MKIKTRYSYKELKSGEVSVYKDNVWQCFVVTGGVEKAKQIFEPADHTVKKTHKDFN